MLKIVAPIVLLILAVPAAAQRAATITATGEHRLVAGDTNDSARQLALLEADRKTWLDAIARVRTRPDIAALQLTALELEAFTGAVLESQEDPQAPGAPGRTVRATVRTSLDPAQTARRIIGLRKDADASHAVTQAWSQIQELERQIADDTRRRASGPAADATAIVTQQMQRITSLRVKLMVARASAALARTEARTVGGFGPSDAGRQRAREIADAAVALAPDSPDAHFLMGDLLVDAERPEEAEAEYRKALSSNPDSSDGRLKLAEALRLQDKNKEAVTELGEVLRAHPELARAHLDLGTILAAQQSFQPAMDEYREAIRLDPRSSDAHNGLAIALARQGRLEDAVVEFREVVRIDPDSAIGYYNLAYTLADLDRDVESAAALREVVRINPNHYNARYNLGELFRLEGKYDDSARQFREFLRLAPATPQNQRNITRARRFVEQFEN